jgi:arginine:ornithine antiporter/lysine permease
METFRLDFSGLALGVPVWEQVKNTMLITLWVYRRRRRGRGFRPRA